MLHLTNTGRPRLGDVALATVLDAWYFLTEPLLLRVGRFADRCRRRGREHPALVSVPIATYDRIGILVSRTIPSILAQTYPAIEVIVVADGTPDELLRPLRTIEDRRVRVRRLRRRTRYPEAALERWMVAGTRPRNVGAWMSKGEWILWISDDDILLPDAVEHLVSVAEQGGSAVESVFGSYKAGTTEPRVIRPSDGITQIGFAATGPPAWLMRRRLRHFRWNRQSWRRLTERPSDYDLIRRMRRAGARFATTDRVVALQPDVPGTGRPGRLGALLAAERED